MSPCMNCEKRYLACHDNCPEYKEWREHEYKRKFKPNQYYRSSATNKLYRKRKNATYKGREFKWMKIK